MSMYQIELQNAHDVTWECVAAAVDLARSECAGELIESIRFGSDWIGIERVGRPVKVVDFPVRRYERVGEGETHAD